MRGQVESQPSMLTLMNPDSVVPKDHPIRGIKGLADDALSSMGATFDRMYATAGRPSIPPERLLKAQLLIALYSVRSERLFCEQLGYNLLFRWFLDMNMDEKTFDASTFSQNRDRQIEHDVARTFFGAVVQRAELAGLVSKDHFSVDGTLFEAWASLKSFKRKDGQSKGPDDDDKGNPTVNFRGEKRRNETHQSSTDPDAKLSRHSDGTTAKLCFAGHGLMENRHGLLVDMVVTKSVGVTEREAALDMLLAKADPHRRRTVGGDKGYDTNMFVEMCRMLNISPHVAANTGRRGGAAVDGKTTRHAGYQVSQKLRKRIEEIWGWMKTVGGLRKTRFKGTKRVNLHALFAGAAYNLLRMARLMAA